MNAEVKPVKEKVLDLANKISQTKRGSKREIKPTHAEYLVLEPMVTEEMAELLLNLKFREPQTVAQVSAASGWELAKTQQTLLKAAEYGAAFMQKLEGEDKFWLDVWVPGHLEMIVNNKALVEKYPQIGKAFDDYGQRKGPAATGNIPVGFGPMRVIPIETAIDGNSRSADYEELSKYLDENTVFSVSDCSCRTSREAMGEGCGHLKEDMCIQMGKAAEFYIRTERGREITREEARDIILKAEKNGLMHQIPNFDGSGETHAICNCCGCGCYALRNANMFNNPDMIRSNYRVKIDADKCVACGECVENCPTNALKLGQKLCAIKPVEKPERELPYNTEWGKERFNPDFRTNKQVVEEEGSAPCKASCPAHIGIQGYMKLASQGRYTEALELIKHENPFPAVCGRICPKACEAACTRGDIDSPVAIDDIKKFVAQQDLNSNTRFIPEKKHDYRDKKIAVIGSGPAGLTCAYFLAVDGYSVTVFEKQPTVGGMLTLGIPSFRLEKEVINAEIDVLRQLGVEFKTNTTVGADVTLAELRKQDYRAFYVAIGAQGAHSLNVEGEDALGVVSGVGFLRSVNLGEMPDLGGQVVVIGGGNVAIDVARTAVRFDVEAVTLCCLENRENMPAHEEEIVEAIDEGISLKNGWGPKRIITQDGKVTGVELKKCLRTHDEQGKFSPVFDEATSVVIDADQVLVSVGQAMDWGALLEGSAVTLNPNQTVIADATTYQTQQDDVFVGGDALTGPRFAIDAIAQGKEGAISIHRFVQHGQSLTLGRLKREYKPFDKSNIQFGGYDDSPRQQTQEVSGEASRKTFKDLRETFSEEQVIKETERCLGCGVAVADEYMCVGCGACTTRCKFGAISLEKAFDAEGKVFEEAKKTIIKYALKRKVKLAVTKPIRRLKSKIKTLQIDE